LRLLSASLRGEEEQETYKTNLVKVSS
jgi:hypothetical protein